MKARTYFSATDVKHNFADVVNNVAFGDQVIIVQRHGKDVAAIISADDFKRFEELEKESRS